MTAIMPELTGLESRGVKSASCMKFGTVTRHRLASVHWRRSRVTILTWAAAKGDVVVGGLLLLTYSLGFAVPMLGIAYSTKLSSAVMGAAGKTMWVKRVAGLVLIVVGVYLINLRYAPLGTFF